MKRYEDKPQKTCIQVNLKYRQHKLSALIDTGSDVSIAGEDVARDLGWPIYAHHTKEVSVANNKAMPILGATRVVLIVAGHGIVGGVDRSRPRRTNPRHRLAPQSRSSQMGL